MVNSWKVVHHLGQPIQYGLGPTNYPELKISIILENGNIVRIEQILTVEDGKREEEVIAISNRKLITLWETLEYWWGHQPSVNRKTAKRLGTSSADGIQLTGFLTVSVSAFIAKPVRLPLEKILFYSDSRLHVWLRLVNEARQASSPNEAIRNYYMVWEDMKGRPDSVATGSHDTELKYVRDFVSHGEPLRNPKLLAFLQQEIGKTVGQYDPHDLDQLRFVQSRRDWARSLVETELEKLL
jgi:hypothetical protein